ncbi:MAG: response regulator [Planctomycetaceae bacterium]|nr:response regulator [Planctomycetaceae bacterium]
MPEAERKKVVLVDDDATNLISGKNVLKDQYEIFTVPSGEKLFELIHNQIIPDLILLDVEMPVMNGYCVLQELKKNPFVAEVPVIFVTGRQDVHSELEGLLLGAVDYITKPFSPPLLLKRIESHLISETRKKQLYEHCNDLSKMVERQTLAILDLQKAIFSVLANVVEYRDGDTGTHICRTQRFFRTLIDGLLKNNIYSKEVNSWDVPLMLMSSQLHDIGKVAIPDAILLKPGTLTPEEFNTIKTHTIVGAQIIEGIEQELKQHRFIRYAQSIALSHHEKWDGTGYPYSLSGQDIPLQGRCMSIVDVYDALVSIRPYKPSYTHEKALQIITDRKGTCFDPLIVEAFLDVSDEIYAESQKTDTAKSKKYIGIQGTNISELTFL